MNSKDKTRPSGRPHLAAAMLVAALVGCAPGGPPGDPSLAGLDLSLGSLDPPFHPDRSEYRVELPYAASALRITLRPTDPQATVSPSAQVDLRPPAGESTARFDVLSPPGESARTYTIVVARAKDHRSPAAGFFAHVPAGRYQRGEDAKSVSVVSDFRMAAQEVSRRLFLEVMEADPSNPDISSGLDDPVQGVRWYQAIAFCNKLSLLEGLSPVYSVDGVSDWGALAFGDIPSVRDDAWDAAEADWEALGYRLPTLDEWRWAAAGAPPGGRNGAIERDIRLKPFAGSSGSNLIGEHVVYRPNSGPGDGDEEPRRTRPAGSKRPNELGLYDLSGNVFEWLWDGFEAGSQELVWERVDYRGTGATQSRWITGASYRFGANQIELFKSTGITYPYAAFDFGIRLVLP